MIHRDLACLVIAEVTSPLPLFSPVCVRVRATKVILHGEHSVVYGKAALAVSIGLRTKVVVTRCRRRREALVGAGWLLSSVKHLFPTWSEGRVRLSIYNPYFLIWKIIKE